MLVIYPEISAPPEMTLRVDRYISLAKALGFSQAA
jgi:hypothetical protein